MYFRKTRNPTQGIFNTRPKDIVCQNQRILQRVSIEREANAYLKNYTDVQKVDTRPFTLNLDATRKIPQNLNKQSTKAIKNNLIKYKHDQNATAIAETQLIGFHEFNKESLEGKVDLEKVKEIRRAIRRRYANRGNIQKIFNLWDEDNKGTITPEEVFSMMEKFGIKANKDEIKVLVASADHDKDGYLNLDEFMDLIYNDNEALNVDLKNLYADDESSNEKGKEMMMEMLDKDLQLSSNKRKFNQLMLVLKSKYPHFVRFFKEVELDSKNTVASKQKLEEAIRASGLSEERITPDNLEYIFKLNAIDNHNFDFREFVNQIRDFKFIPQYAKDNQTISDLKKPSTDIQNWLKRFAQDGLLNSKEFHVHDVNKASLPLQEKIIKGTMKLSRYIKKFFPNATDFKDYFSGFLQIPIEQLTNETIDKTNLQKAIESFANNIDTDLAITKEDMECFCSSLNYNNIDKCSISLIFDVVYKEDKDGFYKRVWNKRYGPPPVTMKYSYDLPDDGNSQSETNVNWASKTQINGLFDRIDKKFYSKHENCLKMFRSFDIDNDGFITHEDILSKAEEQLLIKSKEDASELIQYMDPENKGFLTISDFNRKFRKDILLKDENSQNFTSVNLYPNKEYFETMRLTSEMAFSRIPKKLESSKEFENPYKWPATRYGANPPFQNTFGNFKGVHGSSLYINESDRLLRRREAENNMVFQERKKRETSQTHKLIAINQLRKTHQEIIDNRLYSNDEKEQRKMKSKGAAQWTYEHVIDFELIQRAHLKCDWK